MICPLTSGLLFACSPDDCVLYRNIHSLHDCLILQEYLTSLGQRKADWQMKFNVAKCHSMRVTRHQHHKQIFVDYSLHNQTLENVQSAKYLGITITDNMYWGQHVSEISSKASSFLICNHLNWEEKAGCFTLFVFLVSCGC